jgi:nitroimidazol reductase NimA-like FMN-containing flavoprotein (pyridoxamine 5'-phosphate oxidase superfamily)
MSLDENDVRDSLLGVDVSDQQARETLEAAEFGVLGLADGSESYTIPLSFGYDEGLTTLYYLLGFGTDSKKREMIAATETASFVVTQVQLPDAWESIMFTGTVGPVPEGKTVDAYGALAETAAFPATHTFDEYFDPEDVEQSLYKFDVDTVTARRSDSGESGEERY